MTPEKRRVMRVGDDELEGSTSSKGLKYPIRCRMCSQYFEKGTKPQKGQGDELFVCDSCQDDENDAAAAQAKKAKR